MDWKQLLISITSSVDEELRLRNTYLVTENRILHQQIQGRVQAHCERAQRTRRDWPEAGQKGSGRDSDGGQTRHDLGVAPYVCGPAV
jgi:hypothetical protein